jgi:6-phosphogluconolactonase
MIERRCLFANRQDLAEGLSADVADELRRAIAAKGRATLAVSGGTTPQMFFERLSHQNLNWPRVTITLVDEREVPESHPRSNAAAVQNHLMQNHAAGATFIGLYQNPAAAHVPPFDVVVLGMGNDGHTASFFPGGDTLAKALDRDGSEKIISLNAPAAWEPRRTFTLPVLLEATLLCLHIEGPAKQDVLTAALAEGPESAMPIRAVLRAKTPLSLYWCP